MPSVTASPITEYRHGQFHFGPEGLRISVAPRGRMGDPTFEDWQACGLRLRGIERQIQFWIGDWVNYGRARWGEAAEQGIATDIETIASEATGWKPETVEQYARVARQVPAERRDPDLSFGHHREVADRPADEQARWLATAKTENLSTDKLRRAIKAETTPDADQTVWLVVSCRSFEDREALRDRLRAEGRETKEP